uniref:Uncharacterized protein n=1 Tax=Siphoviridae sp. ctoOf8 TaxID=2825668 RepID=A0A8S5QEY2_9CAUD|nr:MAG TPA: hypothetical protein [Siphoviridae sp. ctoOf8]
MIENCKYIEKVGEKIAAKKQRRKRIKSTDCHIRCYG